MRLDTFGYRYVREYVEGRQHREAADLPRIRSGPAGTRMNPAATLAIHLDAALGEIAGGFAFWTRLRLTRIAWRAVADTAALIAFAWFPTRADVAFAGRAYAACGGVYIASSLTWAVDPTKLVCLWGGRRPGRGPNHPVGAARVRLIIAAIRTICRAFLKHRGRGPGTRLAPCHAPAATRLRGHGRGARIRAWNGRSRNARRVPA